MGCGGSSTVDSPKSDITARAVPAAPAAIDPGTQPASPAPVVESPPGTQPASPERVVESPPGTKPASPEPASPDSEAYEVSGAGESSINGVYRQSGETYDGVPVFVHQSGVFRILRYRFNSTGNAYWFITSWDLKGKTYSHQDVYRTKATSASRPPADWCDSVTICGKKPTVFGTTAPVVRELTDTAKSAAPDSTTTPSEARYMVTGAGEEIANGLYLQAGLYDGVPQYMNEHGVTLLRYRFKSSKNSYWFFSQRDKDGSDSLDRDLYRTPKPSEATRPPGEFIAAPSKKPTVVGKPPVPVITCQAAGEVEDEEDKLDGTEAVDMSYPGYWSSSRSVALGDSFSKQTTTSKAIWADVDRLLKQSFTGKRTRDRKGRPMPSSLTLRNLLRVENSSMWNRYAAKRAHLRRRVCPSLEELYGGAPVMTAWEGQGLVSDVNEFYLWHGTAPSLAMNIVSEGFRIVHAGKSHGAMFGRGAYFAEASSKSDEYAEDEDDGLYAGLFAMLLCRVCCGRIHRVLGPDAGRIERAVESGAFDTVLGDREAAVGTYREFVVFDAAQVYPEYALVYAREYEEES